MYNIKFAVNLANALDKVCGESVNKNEPRVYHFTNWNHSNEVLSLTADTQITELSDGPRFMLICPVKTPISSQKMLERFLKNLMISTIYSDYVVIQCKNIFDTFIDTPFTQYTLVVTENTMRNIWKKWEKNKLR